VEGREFTRGIEYFFQKNTYHPFATCGNLDCGKAGPISISSTAHNTHPEQTLPTQSIEHFCDGDTCFTTDPTNFRSNRHHIRDGTFLDKAGIFDFRTIASGKTIREPVTTFRKFSQLIARMPSHKAPGFSEVPADLFKQAPISFQKRIHLLVNEILTGRHDCDTELLMAKVILIHKDKDTAILDHYRPIALLNTIYQLIMLIITSRLRQLTEYYAVMEGSQYGFRIHRGVQMVVQRAHWVQQPAMKESGTLIRIDLDFKNAFNSAGHSCLWAILRGLGVPDVDFLEDLYSKLWMKITVGTGHSRGPRKRSQSPGFSGVARVYSPPCPWDTHYQFSIKTLLSNIVGMSGQIHADFLRLLGFLLTNSCGRTMTAWARRIRSEMRLFDG